MPSSQQQWIYNVSDIQSIINAVSLFFFFHATVNKSDAMGIGQRNIIIITIIIRRKKENFFGNFSACFVDVFVIIPGLLSQLLFSTFLIYYAENVSSRASGAQRNSVQSHMHQLQYIQRVLV